MPKTSTVAGKMLCHLPERFPFLQFVCGNWQVLTYCLNKQNSPRAWWLHILISIFRECHTRMPNVRVYFTFHPTSKEQLGMAPVWRQLSCHRWLFATTKYSKASTSRNFRTLPTFLLLYKDSVNSRVSRGFIFPFFIRREKPQILFRIIRINWR